MTTMSGPSSTIEDINARYPLHIRRFASGQYLSSLAYYLAAAGPAPHAIKVLREDGTFKDYIVKPFPLKKGMYGYILLPKDKSLKDVKVIFRGTDFADPKSIAINLEMWGPGSASFATEEKKIFHTLKQALHEHYHTDENETFDDLTLEVSGHSQGAALTQLFTNAFLKHRANDSNFDQIKNLKMTALNSPGVPSGLEKSAAENVRKQSTAKKPLKIVANYGMVGGDSVQVTGFDMIFSTLPPELVELNLLKVDKGLEGHWLKAFELEDGLQIRELWEMGLKFHASLHGAHSNVNFYAPIDANGKICVNSKYQYFTNMNENDRKAMAKELNSKIVYTQHAFIFVKMFLYYLLEYKESMSEFSPLGFVKNLFWHTVGNSLSEKLKRWFSSYRTTQASVAEIVPVSTQPQIPAQDTPTMSQSSGIFNFFSRFAKDNIRMQKQCCDKIEKVTLSNLKQVNLGEEEFSKRAVCMPKAF